MDLGEIEETVLFFAFGLWEGHARCYTAPVFYFSQCYIYIDFFFFDTLNFIRVLIHFISNECDLIIDFKYN